MLASFTYREGEYTTVVTIESYDPKTKDVILRSVLTESVKDGRTVVTNLISTNRWLRRPRGSEDPVYFLEKNGVWNPIADRDLVDWQVRKSWIMYVPPIEKGDKEKKKKKSYVDVTDYQKWRDKLRDAQQRIG